MLALFPFFLLFLWPATTLAQTNQCTPCLVLESADPAQLAQKVSESLARRDAADARLWVRSSASQADATARASTGGELRRWIPFPISTEAPLLQNAAALEVELEALAALARRHPSATFQIDWAGLANPSWPQEYAFLVKRAGVAITGAAPDAPIVTGVLPLADEQSLRAFFAEEVAAYIDGLSIRDADRVSDVSTVLAQLDPGSETVLHVGDPVSGSASMAVAAAAAAAGATTVVLPIEQADDATVDPLVLLATELAGDVALDPYSTPEGGEAWAFVRGEDLGLRVIAVTASEGTTTLSFSDRQLTSPSLLTPANSSKEDLYTGRRSGTGYSVDLDPSGTVLLALDRNLAQLDGVEGVEEDLTIEDARQMPVEEILRRLQAFEDAQARRLDHYSGINTMSMRFLFGTGVQGIDVTFKGNIFQETDQPADWAWEELFINGVKWRGKRLPEIPLVQPEKAAALPLLISFTQEYRYRLRGTDTVEGRDVWVVDFEPAVAVTEDRTLFQGTVWIDREFYSRVKTRAVQLGLVGDVISNEESIFYTPVDANGQSTDWSREAYVLPTRLVGQQLFSILAATTMVEREVLLEGITINGEQFEARRQAVLESDATVVRDTDKGFRYLVADKETGERVVQEELDPSRLFLVGGAFWDESQDFPLPLAGLNWLSLDFRGTGIQTNVFFAGPLLLANFAKPSVFGSKFDVGLDVFGLAVAGTDSIFRGDEEAEEEDIESLRPNIDFELGRRFGNFFRLDFEYELSWNRFSEADDTAEDFVIPEDHLSHTFGLLARYDRKGYRFRLGGSHSIRSDWEPWGFADNPDFDPEKDEFQLWGAGINKIWHLPKFTKIGAEIEYVGGDNLDRFSKYQFGFFSDIRVHGYRQDRVRAEEAFAAHLSYGFELGELFRLDLVGDIASATDEESGLDNEILAGVGVVGTFLGPWQTVVNVDVGVPVAGPDSGFSAFIAFLKLFR
ncbi:MAG: hypothetical protein AAGA81_08630 [Acidobacteriota bacterium]